jgi:hypothetical protein
VILTGDGRIFAYNHRMMETLVSTDPFPPELLLEGYSPGIRASAERLRAVVREAVPDAIERVRIGWRLIGYDVPVGKGTRYFAMVWPEPEHVHLGFEYGAWMDDPAGILRGAEIRLKKVRFVTFGPGEPIPESTLIGYTRQAVDLATMSRGERLARELDRD